ncbi:hypothetical protein [Nonomuraea gerenzanensis]|uniref:Putative integral membrane protein n=1 Tax=Nonomuraea gerenzanensis TaxID=93944 RepID=A0A1M4E2P0_9ACTN|nr:hypothetical protein [Nonomuraea gerenzanensis]UBU15337.1 hypothetical protein LCN96_10010 [Nonomuraea gerenzanensis]SBO93085.1 putative integral membrane protein [Nonomuraea gerenzanensis]
MIPLAAYRLTAYVRSHRVYQALLLTLALLAIVHGSRAPKGAEATVLVDGAVLLVPILAWAARSLLDTEPDRQREMSAIQVGGRGKEVAAGLLAAFAACVVFAALGLLWALFAGVSGSPPSGLLLAALLLYVVSALAGTALGALTSRAILPSPAISIMSLLLGFLGMLLLSSTSLYWLTVPLISWMKAANSGELLGHFPELTAISLAWCLIGLAAYAWLRRRS